MTASRRTELTRLSRSVTNALQGAALLLTIGAAGTTNETVMLADIVPNDNRHPVGVLRDGVLTVALEAKESAWRPDGPSRPPMTIEAFSEPGKPPLMPGPLVRAPAGTEIRLTVRNSLHLPLTFFFPAAIRGGSDRFTAADSVVVAPGAVGLLTTRASVPGNYLYRAVTGSGTSKVVKLAGLLVSGVVLDTAGAATTPNDRVFVIMQTLDSAVTAYVDSTDGNTQHVAPELARFLYSINGRSWPNTERIAATVGDSLHWRVINASFDVHPMHLHGFYYRVDAFSGRGTGSAAPIGGRFPAVDALRARRAPASGRHGAGLQSRARSDEGRPCLDHDRQPPQRTDQRALARHRSRGQLRGRGAGLPWRRPTLVAGNRAGRFVRSAIHAAAGGDVHVPRARGRGTRAARRLGGRPRRPRFRRSSVARRPCDFLKGFASASGAHPLEVNGEANPDTVVLHVGRPARFRLLNLTAEIPVPFFSLTARPDSTLIGGKDTMIVSWRPVAKDGFDLPGPQALRPARQVVSMGETYDFEYTPQQRGTLRLEVRTNQLLVRVPIRVE